MRHHISREVRATIEHSQNDPADLEITIEVAGNEFNILHQLAESLEGVVLALNRDQNFARGGQGIDRQEAQGWWAIDQNEIEVLLNMGKGFP